MMSKSASADWCEANQRYLKAALGVIRELLERHGHGTTEAQDTGTAQQALQDAAETMAAPPALETLCAKFGLTSFERAVLLLCAGIELDASFTALHAFAQGDQQRTYPTFSLALAALPGAHWSALTPAAPLRRWRLIEVGAGSALAFSPLRIDERILHYLIGVQHLDDRLVGIVDFVEEADNLVPSHNVLAERLAKIWSQAASHGPVPVVQLCGNEVAAKRAIAAAACARLGLRLCAVSAQAVPADPRELDTLIRLWVREAILGGSALFLECDDQDTSDQVREKAISRLIECTDGILALSSREHRRTRQRPMITFDVSKPTSNEQRATWHSVLGESKHTLDGHIETLVSQFSLNAPMICSATVEALEHFTAAEGNDLSKALWDACRVRARPRLDNLAQRIESNVIWDDLVLPKTQLQVLREISVHVRQRTTVYEKWGFAKRGARGLGISALFVGGSGTGKTLAVEVLANELRLDLYRIDLSQVVSKYIGETEKNLSRVFDAAEEGGVVLLFDEADALFGKRSEVKDSHDRYANIEVSYLLQRMEAYRGLAILTTNMKNALDPAFLRRIRFIVYFQFPDVAQRAEIWRRIFPVQTPTDCLEVTRLAQLDIAGGNIRNIALNAAFLAADANEPVRMKHLLQAARREYAKLEKSLTDAEIGGWV